MKSSLWISAGLIILGGCASNPEGRVGNASFRRTSDDFVKTYLDARPLLGVGLGWHQYDGQFVVPTAEQLAAERERLKSASVRFADSAWPGLTSADDWDRRLITLGIARDLWTLDVTRSAWRNPMDYAGALDIQVYLKRDFAPLAERLRAASRVLTNAGALFTAARANLEPALPAPFVELAIDVAEGGASFLDHDARVEAHRCSDPVAVADFDRASETAKSELRGFASWLKREHPSSAAAPFALGRAGFSALMRTELIDLDPDQLLEIALKELKAEQQRFSEAARIVDPTRPAVEVFKAIQKDHPTAQSLIADTRKNLEAIRKFVADRRLVTIPGNTRARVEETPPPQRSTSFASMNTPGPFETRASEAYYYITPVEDEWPPAQKDEWLTAFNYYTTDVVSIHEAYPGHYVQFLALNASRAGVPAKIFGSYAFNEGWAHYCEQMVLDAGFPGSPASAPDASLRAAKYRLAQSDEALLRVCRLCCAIKLHCFDMTVDEAARFFTDNCYYEPKPARQEAMRGTFDPGYGFYTLGKLQILKLRRDVAAQEAANFDLQRFHDELLRHGEPPIKMLRELMLKDRNAWTEIL
jgi:hypothetical protein